MYLSMNKAHAINRATQIAASEEREVYVTLNIENGFYYSGFVPPNATYIGVYRKIKPNGDITEIRHERPQ